MVASGEAPLDKSADTLRTFEALQEQIEAERQNRIAYHQQKVVERDLTARRDNGPLNILAHGDSWFDYPLSQDIIDFLRRGPSSPQILRLAHYGDSSTTALGVKKRKQIIDSLRNPANGAFDALLFSGGGNDIAGDQFCLWIRQFDPSNPDPANGIDRTRLQALMDVVRSACVDLIDVRDREQRECILFFHAYDFAQPTGLPACVVGPWLKPSLDFRKWTNRPQATQIVKDVLLAFDKTLTQLERDFRNVVYVRTQGTLDPAVDWANETHPTETGFNKLADRFRLALRAKFPGRI